MNLSHYKKISQLFEFPEVDYPSRVKEVRDSLLENYEGAAEYVTHFLRFLPEENLDEMQELYTRTFDVQAITTLDVGYVLFGDDYKRGEMLSHLNKEHNKVKNECGMELADHLSNLLRLVSKMEDQELAKELMERIVGPAVLKMLSEFDPQRIETKKKSYKKHYKTLIDVSEKRETLFLLCLKALDCVISKDFGSVEVPKSKPCNDFLRSVETEMDIEERAGAQYSKGMPCQL